MESGFFNRTWAEYEEGFGNPTAQYWIGLKQLHEVSQRNCSVRFDLQDINGTWFFAQYSRFSVGDSSTNYTLTIGGYAGDRGDDILSPNNGQRFSTYDFDKSGFCSETVGGGFWFSEGCGVVYITTSSLYYFAWPVGYEYIDLNAADVRFLC